MTSETTTNGRASVSAERLPSRRELFALAAVLAATALTAGAAIAGLTRSPGAAPASTPTVDQVITPAPLAPRRVEPGD
jgi:hypothetical protein